MSIRPEWWHCLDLSSISIKHWSIKFMVGPWAKFKLIYEYKFPLQYSDLTTIYFVSTEECWLGSSRESCQICFGCFYPFSKELLPRFHNAYRKWFIWKVIWVIHIYWSLLKLLSLITVCSFLLQVIVDVLIMPFPTVYQLLQWKWGFIYFQEKLNQYSLLKIPHLSSFSGWVLFSLYISEVPTSSMVILKRCAYKPVVVEALSHCMHCFKNIEMRWV